MVVFKQQQVRDYCEDATVRYSLPGAQLVCPEMAVLLRSPLGGVSCIDASLKGKKRHYFFFEYSPPAHVSP